ncbi:MAG TPA: hypothetical protein VED63_12070, partial [Acidimicrobiales bacterium]|nr:hypothetical protein [Acidimicrobiales bacterium]
EESAARFGATVDRGTWRLVGPMHIAETEEQARKDVEFGLRQWVDYFNKVAALPLAPPDAPPDQMIDALASTGFAVIGTPDMAAEQISRLLEQSGGFGAFLFMATEWANRSAMVRSYELFAREVMPRFQGSLTPLRGSRAWAAENRPAFMSAAGAAIEKAFGGHAAPHHDPPDPSAQPG